MSKRRRWTRRLGLGCLAVVAIAVLAAALGLWSLSAPRVQRALLERLSRQTESAMGFAVDAEALRLRPLSGLVEIDGARLHMLGAEPFAGARVVRVRLRPSALLRRPIAIQRIELEEPVIDLTAPLPTPAAGAETEEPPPAENSALPVTVDRLTVTGGRLIGAAVGSRVEGWGVDALEASASFDGRRLDLTTLTAVARLAPGWRSGEPIELDLELAATAGLDRSLEVRTLRLEGDGLTARLDGAVGPALTDAAGSFELEADPGYWLTGTPQGPVEARGTIDLGAWSGHLELRTREQPVSLVAAMLPAALVEDLAIGETTLDLAADLSLEDERTVGGSVRLGLSRRDGSAPATRLLGIELKPHLAFSEGFPLETRFSADLLPADAGKRRLAGQLLAADSTELTTWRIENGTLSIAQNELTGALKRLSRLYPRLLSPETVNGLPVLGSLAADGVFEGPLDSPRVSVDARLAPPAGGRIALSARGPVRDGAMQVTSSGRQVELGGFTSALSGRVDWSATLDDVLGSASGRLEATGTGIETASGEVARSLAVRLAGSRNDLAWRIDADRKDGARLAATGTIVPSLPLARASGEGRIETADSRVPAVDVTFELAGGVLGAEVEIEIAERPPLLLSTRVPLAALDHVPAAATLATLPIERADGPIEASWSAAPGTWRALLPPDLAARLDQLTAGSSGRLVFAPERPADSTLEASVTELEIGFDGRTLGATEPPRVTLRDGRLELETLALSGQGLAFEAAGGLDLAAGWRLGDSPADLGEELRATIAARIESNWLEALPLEVVRPGPIVVNGRLAGPLDRLDGEFEVTAPDLVVTADALPSTPLSLAGAAVAIEDGVARWRDARMTVGDAVLVSHGRTRLTAPLDELEGQLDVVTGWPILEGATVPITVRQGVLEIQRAVLATTGGDGSLTVTVPLDDRSEASLTAEWDVPVNDWAALARHFSGSEDPEVFAAALRGHAEMPLARPAELAGLLRIDGARIVARGRETRIEPAFELTVADGELRVAPLELRTASETFSFEATVTLDRQWVPARPPEELVSRFSVQGDGHVDAALLNPFLAGGRGDGPLGITLELAGTPADWDGRVRIAGPDASLLFRGTYLIRIEKPDLEFAIVDGVVRLERGHAQLNEGGAELSGLIWDGERLDLSIQLRDALLRLDYGLLTRIGADLRLSLAAEEPLTLAGAIDVERGSLTRTLRPDLDFVGGLLSPVDLSTTEESALDLLTLDLEIRTREGVRIDNNLAEMLVRWEPLQVTGTAARPVIEGRLEADPGGLLFLYGQTVRLDKAAIEYPGIENADARLEFEATTSLEDPTIGRLAGNDPFRSTRRGEEPPVADATGDLARYVGESLAGRVGEAVGVTLSLRPLLIFGETDPGARLTVSRDLSPYLALAASVDLRQAENQTYLLEAHELEALPRLVAQVFSDDQSDYGTAILQRREFGGSRPEADRDLPRVGRLEVEPPPGVSKRGLRRAIGLDRGEVFDADRRFAAEVELVDYLRRKGYADAEVSIRALEESSPGRRSPLEVAIHAGPRARFDFSGEKLPKPLRRVIIDLYRADFFEPESLVEMEAEAVRALRSRGFLDPRVAVAVEPLDPGQPEGDRRVVIAMEGGHRVSPKPPVFLGLPPEEVEVLDALFFNSVQRVELAVGLPSADRRLLAALADLGYPEARIASRYESLEDRALTVELEPGPRLRIDRVDVVDATGAADLPADLASVLTVAPGDALRRAALARSALAIERTLGERGHREARVRTLLEPVGADPYAREVRFMVAPGPVSRLAAVEFSGLESTREGWARKVTGLEPGQILTREDLPDARTRLWRTGLFSAVSSEPTGNDPEATRLRFNLAERPRYRLAYGLRWDSQTGLGAVFDATDDNFLGRGWTLGARALFSSEEQSLRGLTRIPRVFGTKGSLELYAALSEITDSVDDPIFGPLEEVSRIRETTLQYSHPVSDATTVRLYGRYAETLTEALFFSDTIVDPALGAQLLYDRRSTEPVLRRGLFASVDLSGSDEFLGGDLRYLRLFAQLHAHRPLGRGARRFTWSQAYRLGLADAFDQELIRAVRFFAGGEYSVRGYATESLGEQGLLGPAGGAALAVINQELRARLTDDYTLVVFADAGEVWPRVGDLGLDLRLAAGLGLRAVTPIGLLRLDLARALDPRPRIDPDYKLYFGLGTVF